jgi:hypothetical protein
MQRSLKRILEEINLYKPNIHYNKIQTGFLRQSTRTNCPSSSLLISTSIGAPAAFAADLGGDAWKGGFYCPCHGSKFDLAGRVYTGVPAPTLNVHSKPWLVGIFDRSSFYYYP